MWVLSCECVYAYVSLSVTESVCASDLCQHGVHFWVCVSFMCVFICVSVLRVFVYVSQYLCWLLYFCVWYICVLSICVCVVSLHMLYVSAFGRFVCVCACVSCVCLGECVLHHRIAGLSSPLFLHLTFSPQTLPYSQSNPHLLSPVSQLSPMPSASSLNRTSGIKSTGSGIRQI